MNKILVYDADKDLVDLICMALELEGYQGFGYHDSGIDYTALVRKIKPALVILEFRITGWQMNKWCRCIKAFKKDLPVIALSADHRIGELFGDQGFDAFIAKPFDLEQFYCKVRCCLSAALR